MHEICLYYPWSAIEFERTSSSKSNNKIFLENTEKSEREREGQIVKERKGWYSSPIRVSLRELSKGYALWTLPLLFSSQRVKQKALLPLVLFIKLIGWSNGTERKKQTESERKCQNMWNVMLRSCSKDQKKRPVLFWLLLFLFLFFIRLLIY